MNRRLQYLLWSFLILAVGLALFWQFAPLPDASGRLARLPISGLGFSGEELPLSEVEKTVFEHVHSLKRMYKIGSQLLIVQVIDASGDRHAIHDPLYCFRGAGWEVASSHDLDVPGGSARVLQLQRKSEAVEVAYWITDGHARHSSPLRYRWQTTLRRLSMGNSGSEPVLVMLQPVNSTAADWSSVFSRFPEILDL